jgi:hypothetical protein
MQADALRDWLQRLESQIKVIADGVKPVVDGALNLAYWQGYQTGATHALVGCMGLAVVILLMRAKC